MVVQVHTANATHAPPREYRSLRLNRKVPLSSENPPGVSAATNSLHAHLFAKYLAGSKTRSSGNPRFTNISSRRNEYNFWLNRKRLFGSVITLRCFLLPGCVKKFLV